MGTLIRVWKTIPMPAGATVKKDVVTWKAKGKKKTGKLAGASGKVSVQVDTWTAQFTDENGKVQRVSTKTVNRSAAEKILSNYEAEVDRVKSGVVTREELAKAPHRHVSLESALEKFRTKIIASGSAASHAKACITRINKVFQETGIDSIAKIRRDAIEHWIADETTKKVRSYRTINAYIISIKSFVQYLVEIEVLLSNPTKSLRKLNYELDRRKIRRAMTADEIERLLKVALTRNYHTPEQGKERALIYSLLLGTGLRSTELSLLTPSQIDFDRCRLTIEATKTKNKKPDILPLRSDLVQSLKELIDARGTQPHERIFSFDNSTILKKFYTDLKAAGIERIGPDGRCLDIHSLRKTFGTMLAKAGVPLTTTQRLMRHSTPVLTAQLYIDVDPVDMMQALDSLPALSMKKVESSTSPEESP